MDEKTPATGLTRYAHTYAPCTYCLAISHRNRARDWLDHARSAACSRRKGSGKAKASSRARLRCGCRVLSEWRERRDWNVWLCFRFFSRRDAVVAITSGGSRNRGEHRP